MAGPIFDQYGNIVPPAPTGTGVVDPNPIVVNGGQSQPYQLQSSPVNIMQNGAPPPAPVAPPPDPMAVTQLAPSSVPQVSAQAPAPRQRLSLAQVIGSIGDTLAATGGKDQLYRAGTQDNQMFPLKIEGARQDIAAKSLDQEQTSGAIQDATNLRVHGLAQAVQEYTQKNPTATPEQIANATTIFGKQLGVHDDVVQKLASNPALAAGLAAYGEKTNGGALAKSFTVLTGADGQPHLVQAGEDGGFHEVTLPDGMRAGGVKVVDTGTTQDIISDKSGKVLSSLAVSGKPGAETQATGVTVDPGTGLNRVSYAAPGSGTKAAADIAAVQAGTAEKNSTTAKNNQTVAAAQEKATAAKTTALAHVTDARDSLAQVYSDMDKLATDPSLKYAVGPLSGRYPDPRGEGVRGQIEALAGEGMAAASAKMKAAMAGGATNIRTQKEFDALTASLIGAVKNKLQTPDQYVANIRAKMAPIKTLVGGLNANAARLSAAAAGKPPAGWGTARVVGK